VLDTWFSSALWPFSTLGWPDDTEDLRRFYPTSVMETGYDILFFWVARMIMMGLEMADDVPFREVYLHGMIRVDGEKMSKVKGNVQDPLDLIERYGTDALRLALVLGTTPGNDISLSQSKLEDCRNFVNKTWNAARFVRNQLGAAGRAVEASDLPGTLADRWIRSRLQATIGQVNSLLGDFQMGEAARVAKDFIWQEYCDWYLEIAKFQLREDSAAEVRQATLSTLVEVLDGALRLLHPFAPFVTETIWQTIKRADDAESLMIAAWPEGGTPDAEAEAEFEAIQDLVSGVRRLRSDYKVDWSRRVPATLEGGVRTDQLRQQAGWIASLGRLEPLDIVERVETTPARALSVVAGRARAFLPLEGLFDIQQELARLGRERQEAAGLVTRSQQLLQRAGFVDKAPPEVVRREREKLEELETRLELLDQRLSTLEALAS
jgi:valyl-tRNA synthetase